MSRQVSMETVDGLTRCLKVSIPSDSVESEIKSRLQSLAGTIKIDGFRQGKVPVNVVETKYGSRIRNEVANELVQKELQEVLMEQDVKIVGQPSLDISPYKGGQDIEFSATFEVYPDVDVPSFESVELDRPTATITEADVDQVIERMRFQKATWTVKEGTAENGDQVFIDYKDTSEEASALDGTQAAIVIGSSTMPLDFEQQLMGQSAGDTLTINLEFPSDYVDTSLAGTKVSYSVEVISVSSTVLPELNEAFVQEFGIENGDMAQLRQEVKNNMQRELDTKIGSLMKSRVFSCVQEQAKITIPDKLIDSEVENIVAQMQERMNAMGERGKQMTMPADEELREQARQRVLNSLLVSEVTKQGKITVSHEKIRQEVEKIADLYEDPAQITQWYYEDMNRLATIEFKLAQDAFVEWVYAQCKANVSTLSFEDTMNLST